MATFLNVFSAEGAHIMGDASSSGTGIHTPVPYVVPPSPSCLKIEKDDKKYHWNLTFKGSKNSVDW